MYNSTGIRVFHGILKLGAADPGIDRKILHRLHEELYPFHLGQFRLEAGDHLAGADFAFLQGLEVDQNPSAVERGIGPVDADKGRQTHHRRVLQDDLGQVLLPLGHG